MKISVETLLLWLLLTSNIIDGAIWEIVGIIVIIYFMMKEFINAKHRIKESKLFICMLILWGIYYLMQVVFLDLDISSSIRLYGITKCICLPSIVMLCFNNYGKHRNIIKDIFPIIMFVGVSALIFYLSEKKFLAFGSLNYIGAIFIILSIYVLKEMPDKYKISKILFLIIEVAVVFTSGSRSILAAMILVIVYICITEDSPRKRQVYFGIIILATICLILMILTFGFNYNYDLARGGTTILYNISRALSVLTPNGRYDQARTDLKDRALVQFKGLNNIQQMIGSGDNRVHINNEPAHNCFLEVLLCYGKFGMLLFILSLGVEFYIALKNSKDKKYIVIIMCTAMLFGYVQPFITTGALFQFIVGLLAVNSMHKTSVYKIYKGKKRRFSNGKICDFKQ